MQQLFNRRWRVCALACVMLVGVLSAVPGATAQPRNQQVIAKLSARLARLTAPAMATRSAAQIAPELSLPAEGPGSLQRTDDGAIITTIQVSDTSEVTQAALSTAGAQILHVSEGYRMISAAIAPDALAAVAALDQVVVIEEALRPLVRHMQRSPQPQATPAASCPTGVVSEGVAQLKANVVQAAPYNLTGQGITVGIVSDSYALTTAPTSASQDVASGDLPGTGNPCGHTTPVNVVAEFKPTAQQSGSDEGRAMLQIIHDLAPNAKLAFATVGNDMFQMADNIRALAKAGATIISDDVVYFGEPFFQDGPVNVAINENAAKGIPHFTAAGNANVLDSKGNNITSYEAAAYRPTTCPALVGLAVNERPKDCHSFAPNAADPTGGFALGAGGSLQLELQWAEPWYGVTTDIDVYVVDSTSGAVLAKSNDTNTLTGQPFEFISFSTSAARNVAVVIGRVTGTGTPRLKYILQGASGIISTEYNATNNTVDIFGPSIGDHAAAFSGIAVAAAPYTDGTQPEKFSSLGPAVHYFGPVTPTGNSQLVTNPLPPLVKQPAAKLATPQVLNKPEFAATDGGQTSFFYQNVAGKYRFYGTSAAAPHAAGVAALLAERAKAKNMMTSAGFFTALLAASATPMSNGSYAANGAGLVNALNAVNAIDNIKTRLYVPLVRQ